ncbi:YceI family protein [Acidisoma cladoniae]|uniref:YceI family protein n=1 Tax=Acidisoma cladoniae TaxID=3040935 RepID=UPI00254E833E|nr:YceI family protein [Acidisoma sp. PAMC 29798]
MIRHLLLGATLGAGIAAAALSPAIAQVATTVAAKVPAGAYSVEPYHTRILFSVSHMGFTTWYGDFTTASGSLNFDSKMPSKSALSISFPTASISTTNPKLDGELKSPMWFDATQFPTITFKSTKITLLGHDEGKITGDLTFHGVTKPVTLTAHFNGGGVNPLDKKYTIGFDATGTISRAEFGVKTYEPLIGDSVKLMLSGAFEAQS